MKKINEDHKEIASGQKKDDEGYMARSELDQIERSINNLRKSIKSGKQQLPAWVQSKITKAADYIDTAAEYLQSDETVDEENNVSFTVDPKQIKASQKASKIRTIAQKGSTEGERQAAQNKAKGPTLAKGSISTGVINAEYKPSLVEKILGEEKCGKGMYWCNTDKVCKSLPEGMKIPGQKNKSTEVGIGKPVAESCNHSQKGKSCPVHGMKECPISEEKDPKGPVKPFKSTKELAKKHGVSVEEIEKQLKIGVKVESEHTSDKKDAKITALQHLDEVPDYYTKLRKMESQKESTIVRDSNGNLQAEFVDLIKPGTIEQENPQWKKSKTGMNESIRLQSQNGHIIGVTLSWRGKYYSLRTFFPQTKIPNRKEVNDEIQKIYPGAKVVAFGISDLSPGQPVVQIQNSKSKNYLLNNKTIGEKVEIKEAKKSEMPCNKPKAEAHGSGETGKSHVVKACSDGQEKLIRFGQKGVKGSPKKEGESEAYANRRKRFQARHSKNIAKGKMSAAYWANKVKW